MAFLYLFFVLLHFAFGIITGYRMHEYLIFGLKVCVYMTALILFLNSLKPLKTIAIYYSFYALSALLSGLVLFLVGYFCHTVCDSVFPIVPKQALFETRQLKIYSRFQVFLAPCCSYEVVKSEWVLLEKIFRIHTYRKHY